MIVIDKNIPYIKGVFEPFTEVVYAKGTEISPEMVKEADALIVRTRTSCNESLLKDSAVKFIATATIGTDHIDKVYCDEKGIKWSFAPGCNADGVAHYLFATLQTIAATKQVELSNSTLGIIGVGNVGSRVAKVADAFGMKVLLNDPPRERMEGSNEFVGIEEIQKEADFITLHVPLNRSGEDKTLDLVGDDFLSNIRKEVVIINSCRGEVIDQDAVLKWAGNGLLKGLAVDVWPGEPKVNPELLSLADIATPHIAGYSINGKLNATIACVRFIGKNLGYPLENWMPAAEDVPVKKIIEITSTAPTDVLLEIADKTYDISAETGIFKSNPESFESLRNNYDYRYEASNFILSGINNPELREKLSVLGFEMQ